MLNVHVERYGLICFRLKHPRNKAWPDDHATDGRVRAQHGWPRRESDGGEYARNTGGRGASQMAVSTRATLVIWLSQAFRLDFGQFLLSARAGVWSEQARRSHAGSLLGTSEFGAEVSL